MKRIKNFSIFIFFYILLTAGMVFAEIPSEGEEIKGTSLDTEVIATTILKDQQTSTAILDGSSWEVEVVSIPTLVSTTATLSFNNGMLAIENWIFSLSPGEYEAFVKYERIFFSAILTKSIGPKILYYEVTGMVKTDKRIFGLIYNQNTGLSYLFYGTPSLLEE